MRKYFDKKEEETKLERFGRTYGAEYIEDGLLVWKIKKQYGTTRLAISINRSGEIRIGKIIESCDNFANISSGSFYYTEELAWFGEMSKMLQKWKYFS